MKEIWKDVEGYEGKYSVSNMGRVKSDDYYWGSRKMSGRILSTVSRKYPIVALYKNGSRRDYKVHRIVAMAFIPNPQSLPYVNHKNGVKADNRAENLEWCTPKENAEHAIGLGLYLRGEKFTRSKLTSLEVEEIRVSGETCEVAAKRYNVSKSNISAIRLKQTWRHVL
jgi:hypothetical protein